MPSRYFRSLPFSELGGTSQPAIWWQIDYTGPLPSWWGGHRFGLHWNTHFLILDIYFPLLPEILLLARPSVCSRNTSFTVLVFHTILLLIREFISEQCKCISGFVLTGIHQSYLACPVTQKQSLGQNGGWPTEDLLMIPAGLKGWGSVLQSTLCALNLQLFLSQ